MLTASVVLEAVLFSWPDEHTIKCSESITVDIDQKWLLSFRLHTVGALFLHHSVFVFMKLIRIFVKYLTCILIVLILFCGDLLVISVFNSSQWEWATVIVLSVIGLCGCPSISKLLRKWLILIGKWLDCHQTCTRWCPGRPARSGVHTIGLWN